MSFLTGSAGGSAGGDSGSDMGSLFGGVGGSGGGSSQGMGGGMDALKNYPGLLTLLPQILGQFGGMGGKQDQPQAEETDWIKPTPYGDEVGQRMDLTSMLNKQSQDRQRKNPHMSLDDLMKRYNNPM
jgi:hypothetical protein